MASDNIGIRGMGVLWGGLRRGVDGGEREEHGVGRDNQGR
jgi:hypothetical protein